MSVGAVVAFLLGLAVVVVGFAWIWDWSLVVVLLGLVLMLGGGIWQGAVAADKAMKQYIDYAKKEKDDGGT